MQRRRSETDLNGDVQRALRGLDPCRVENAVGPGTPDINYSGGWIEDKFLRTWPKGENTLVRVPHYKPEQRAWHVKRRCAGGVVHVVIEVVGEVFVFDAAVAAQHLGFITRRQMYNLAELSMRKWDGDAFRKYVDYSVRTAVAYKPTSGTIA